MDAQANVRFCSVNLTLCSVTPDIKPPNFSKHKSQKHGSGFSKVYQLVNAKLLKFPPSVNMQTFSIYQLRIGIFNFSIPKKLPDMAPPTIHFQDRPAIRQQKWA